MVSKATRAVLAPRHPGPGAGPVSHVDPGGFARLLREAAEEGIPDAYSAKRAEPRYSLRSRIEVRHASAPEPLPATLRDISRQGAGFEVHGPFHQDQIVELRVWPAENESWIGAKVEFVEGGMGARLVGVRFLRALPQPVTRAAPVAPREEPPARPRGRGRWLLLLIMTLVGAGLVVRYL